MSEKRLKPLGSHGIAYGDAHGVAHRNAHGDAHGNTLGNTHGYAHRGAYGAMYGATRESTHDRGINATNVEAAWFYMESTMEELMEIRLKLVVSV